MNASTRRALQKRKQLLHGSRAPPSSIDTDEIRNATKNKFIALLLADSEKNSEDKDIRSKAEMIATKIEEPLHEKFKAQSTSYRSSFRRLFLSLRNEKLEFRNALLEGSLEPRDFALKSSDELKSMKRRIEDESLRKEEMQMSVCTMLLPETVNQLKDGRDREKWGVSRSAAALDD